MNLAFRRHAYLRRHAFHDAAAVATNTLFSFLISEPENRATAQGDGERGVLSRTSNDCEVAQGF